MKSVLLVGCPLKEQIRIKNFLHGSFAVRANPSVNNSLDTLARQTFDLLIYDADNAVPLPFFIDQMPGFSSRTPVAVFSSTTKIEEIEKFDELGIVAIIKKPCNKKGLLKGIQESLATTKSPPGAAEGTEEETAPPFESGPVYRIKKTETDVMIGLRKQAVICKIGTDSVSFLLPASLAVGAKMMFRNSEFLELIGIRSKSPPTFEIEVKNCAKIGDFQFRVDAVFADERWGKIREQLGGYVKNHAISRKVPSASKTVLLADEDSLTREFFRAYLDGAGFKVEEAADGFQALEALEGGSVDLLVIDLLLSKLSGQEVIEILKKRNNLIPIIVATGQANPTVVKEVKPRVQGFLPKPVIGRDLVSAAEKILEAWKEEASASAGNGEPFVEVRIATNLMVAFRDRIKLIKIGPDGLTFSRNGPIAPGTLIFARTDAISLLHDGVATPVPSLELKVSQCRRLVGSPAWLVDAEIVGEAGVPS